jgi:putative transposase
MKRLSAYFQPTRFSTFAPWQSQLILSVLVIVIVWAVAFCERPAPLSGAVSGTGDADVYLRIIDRLRAGEDYYSVVGSKLRQADVLIGQGKNVPDVCREIGVSQQTYYRWRNKYGGMSPDMIKQLRELQKENARLRKVVADQAIDIAILKEVAQGN